MAEEIETSAAGPVPGEQAAVGGEGAQPAGTGRGGTGAGAQPESTGQPVVAERAQPTSTAHPGATEDAPIRLAQGREHVVATVDEIPPGSSKVVPIGRHGVGVYNVNGTFYAIANYCPHEGGPLCAGRARGRTVVDDSVPGDSVMVRDNEFIYCPWHQWGFELATGTTAVKPEWSIRTYPVRVVGDDVLVTA